MEVFATGGRPAGHGPHFLNLVGASPAQLAKSHLINTLEEDDFDVGETSGHL